jgi:hypothetical protein
MGWAKRVELFGIYAGGNEITRGGRDDASVAASVLVVRHQ